MDRVGFKNYIDYSYAARWTAIIDNKYITPLTSGLTYLVEKSKGFEHAGIMHVNGIERSRLAAFAEENL